MTRLRLVPPLGSLAVVALVVSAPLHAADPPSGSGGVPAGPVDAIAVQEAAPEAPQDVRVQLLVRTSHEWAQAAVSEARFRLRALQGALEQSPFPVDEVEVGDLHVEPVLEEELLPVRPRLEREVRVVGYRAIIPVTVLSPEPGVVGHLVQLAEGAGAELDLATEPGPPPTELRDDGPGAPDPKGSESARSGSPSGRTLHGGG